MLGCLLNKEKKKFANICNYWEGLQVGWDYSYDSSFGTYIAIRNLNLLPVCLVTLSQVKTELTEPCHLALLQFCQHSIGLRFPKFGKFNPINWQTNSRICWNITQRVLNCFVINSALLSVILMYIFNKYDSFKTEFSRFKTADYNYSNNEQVDKYKRHLNINDIMKKIKGSQLK